MVFLKKLLIAALFCLPAPLFAAAPYYFSDCAGATHYDADGTKGCYDDATIGSCVSPGSNTNPFCPDPNGDETNEIMGWVSNGSGTEVATGETIYLCADDCTDGSGTATILQEATMTSQTGGWTLTVPAGEIVTLTGGATGALNVGLGQHFVIGDPSHSDITFDGYNLSNFYKNFFWLGGNNADNITIQNMDMGYIGMLQTDVGVGDITNPVTGGACGAGHTHNSYPVYMQDNADAVSTFTFDSNTVHHICKFAIRCNNHAVATDISYTNNTFYNIGAVNNDFECNNLNITGNTIWDFHDGISVEDRCQDAIIADNTLECRGTYRMPDGGSCRKAIIVADGDANSQPGRTHNVVVKRNKIWSRVTGAFTNGNLSNGIWWNAQCHDGVCDTGTGACVASGTTYSVFDGASCTVDADCECTNVGTIENNLIWNVRPRINSWPDPGIGGGRGGIQIATDSNGLTIQNNTIAASSFPLVLNARTAGTAHVVKNNLIVASTDNRSPDVPRPGMFIFPNASTSTIDYNNVYTTGNGNMIEYTGGADYTCTSLNQGSFNSNICEPATFVDNTSIFQLWNLHLDDDDVGAQNRGTNFAATEDYDTDVRPNPADGASDIGGDEVYLLTPAQVPPYIIPPKPDPTSIAEQPRPKPRRRLSP